MPDRLTKLTKLHAAAPTDADLPFMIAMEHQKAGRLDEAITWLDKTLSLDAGYCYAYFQKGKLLGELGDKAGAKRVLEAGVAQAQATGNAKARDEIAGLLAMVT